MIVALYAGLAGFMLIALSVNVIKGRRRHGAALGDAGSHDLQRRIRAHANFAEYTGLFLILLGLAEHGGLPAWAVHAFGFVFAVGRLLHAYSLCVAEQYVSGIIQGNPRLRVAGMICTFISIAFLSVILTVTYLGGGF